MASVTERINPGPSGNPAVPAFRIATGRSARKRASTARVFGVIPSNVLHDKRAFIEQSRTGIPGMWVKNVVDETGMRDTFLAILGVTSGNLSRVFRRKALAKDTSEEILDAVRVIDQAIKTWESKAMAMQWLSSPIAALGGECPKNMFDTFEGRRWVSQVLNKVEHGDFS